MRTVISVLSVDRSMLSVKQSHVAMKRHSASVRGVENDGTHSKSQQNIILCGGNHLLHVTGEIYAGLFNVYRKFGVGDTKHRYNEK
jgi:hypothetical protein